LAPGAAAPSTTSSYKIDGVRRLLSVAISASRPASRTGPQSMIAPTSASTVPREIRRDIPILLMSGFIGGGVTSRAREAGANEVMKKPLSARELAIGLARVLRP